jgi:hypothetical protein
MTSLARLAGEKAPTLDEARRVVTQALAERLGYDAVEWVEARRAWALAGPTAGKATDDELHPNERIAGGLPAH